jgi:hypothetical protein
MIKVKFSSPSKWPWLRQTPGRKGIWGNCQFIMGDEDQEFDYWFVHEGTVGIERAKCPRENVIFITGEPPGIKTYNPFFLRQFSQVVSHQPMILHNNVTHWQPGLPWMVGAKYIKNERRWSEEYTKDYDELKAIRSVHKDKTISVITSNKYFTKGHRLRLDFIRKLDKALGSEVDTFITSEVDLEDKWDGIARYKYHVVIENDICPDFWTEKIADPLLGLSLPLYYGCPNISRYFPNGSNIPIDIKRPDRAIGEIQRIISEDRYQDHLPNLMEAKDLVLDKYNLFAMMASFCIKDEKKRDNVQLKPELTIPMNIRPAHLVKKAIKMTGINK